MIFEKLKSMLGLNYRVKNDNITEDNNYINKTMPRHVAVIMDGNSRWAKSHLLPTFAGHAAGAKAGWNLIKLIATTTNIEVLTLYAFSYENWDRPVQEVNSILKIGFDMADSIINKINEMNIRLIFIGDRSKLIQNHQDKLAQYERITKNNDGLRLLIAVSYSGQWDILQAVNKLIANKKVALDSITENDFESALSTAGLPMPDLLIRTGGDVRISNFLLWQLAYTELYFTEIFWPTFDKEQFQKALNHFEKCKRRFGKRDE